jgi:hypothetical protein
MLIGLTEVLNSLKQHFIISKYSKMSLFEILH